jgi:contactin associated protein-like 2
VDYFTDGLWHNVKVDIESGGSDKIGKINFTVDGRPDTSSRQLVFTTTETYLIGGGDEDGGETGFIGCMREIEIGNERIDTISDDQNKGVINGSCSVQDRCDPNPCEHGGICSQDYTTFECNCDNTGYEGAVCHKSRYLVSCEEARMLNPTLTNVEVSIDVDDSGPLEPIAVNCVFQRKFVQFIEWFILQLLLCR